MKVFEADGAEKTAASSPTDTDAIHDNQTGEINAVAVKGTPADADVVLIEDSAASYAKKKATLSTLPAPSHTIASHSDTTATGAELETLTDGSDAGALHAHEGTAIKSTGEVGGTKFLREDGDNTCSWQEATPGAHAASHTNGTDDIQDATAAQKGLMTAAYGTKLDGIEALADVTATAETSHADVVQDGDFGSNGIMTRTGAGAYAVIAQPSGTVVGHTDTQTLTNKDLTGETNKLRHSKSVTIEDPADGDRIVMFMNERAITVLGISFASAGGTSVLFNVEFAATIASGTVVHTDTCATVTPEWDVTPSGDATIPTDQIVCIEITTVTGSVDDFHVTIYYDED
jgi:hypothetical protein